MFPVPKFQNRDLSRLPALYPQIEKSFSDFVAQNHIPGLAYGIVVDGGLIHSGGMGIGNVPKKSSIDKDTVFRIASMTKSFTGMALVKLRDEGKLRLDDPVTEYIPELASLVYPTRDSAPITVRNVLTMSAGFPQDDPWADRQLARSEQELTDLLKLGLTFSNPPGITFEYSNYGFAILGRIVTNAAGVPYQTYVREQILKPLGMTSTTFDIQTVAPDRLAMGYRYEDNQWVEETPLPDGAFASIGGMFTTINDFGRYMAFLLSAFPARDDEETGPVKRSSVREMQQAWRQRFLTSSRPAPDLPAVVQYDGYGYGLLSSIDSVLGYSISHGGGLPGYGTFYRILPDYGIGVVAFSNLTYTPVTLQINNACALMLQKGGIKKRVLEPSETLKSAHETLTKLYDQWDDGLIASNATDSFFEDSSLERRRARFEQLRASFGKRLSNTALEPENNLRGRWIMKCRGGNIEMFVTMSPTVPSKIQFLTITAGHTVNAQLKDAVSQVVNLINHWDEAKAKTLFAQKLKLAVLQSQFNALAVQYGKLKLGDVIEGDGKTQTRVRLSGKNGIADMKVSLNPRTKKITDVAFTRPRETSFVP